jgi:hypothetical protein
MWTTDPSFLAAFSTLPPQPDVSTFSDSPMQPMTTPDPLARVLTMGIENRVGRAAGTHAGSFLQAHWCSRAGLLQTPIQDFTPINYGLINYGARICPN